MSVAPPHPRDPREWHLALAAIFIGLCAVRLNIPSKLFFDEVHYLPAVRSMIDLSVAQNMEHPPLGKQLIALGVLVLGDGPIGWRVPSVIFGTLALYSAMRALWFANQSRVASILFGVLLITGFPLIIHARIAMLDIFMIGFVMLAFWMCAGALRENETARWRFAIAGIALGAAMAAKWNAIPIAIVPGLAFFAVRASQAKWQFLTSNRGAPIGGMALWEAGLWLGALPLAIYAASYWPFLYYDQVSQQPGGLIDLHQYMLHLQGLATQPHNYMSVWYEWASNWRSIWYLYEEVDGAQRGVLMIGNPLSSLAMLPALAWCLWAGVKDKRWDALGVFILYAASIGLWVIAPKPVQFYYHYMLPHCFGLAALALGTERLWQRGERLVPAAIVLGSVGLFAYFYPILTAAELEGEMSFLDYAWLMSWR